MKYLIVCGNRTVGGTGTIISILLRTLNANILYLENSVSANFNSFEKSNADLYIVIQPKAIFYMFFWNLFRRNRKVVFIFDAHPLGFISSIFDYITKALPYYLISLLAWVTFDRKFLIVPDGPISTLYPYKKFTTCAWHEFIESRFTKYNSIETKTCLLYYGTPSKAKQFNNFLSLSNGNADLNLKVVGYKTNLIDVNSNSYNYCGTFDGENINITSDIMIWTSNYESYGLSFREYVFSGGRLIFLRPRLNSDRILNGVYLNFKNYNLINVNILNIPVKFPQENVISEKLPLSSYLKNELC